MHRMSSIRFGREPRYLLRMSRPARWGRGPCAALLGVAVFLGSGVASASLSSSERGQIRDFFNTARTENAQKVRSLVARTDLSADESIAALTEAVTPVAFTEQRGV